MNNLWIKKNMNFNIVYLFMNNIIYKRLLKLIYEIKFKFYFYLLNSLFAIFSFNFCISCSLRFSFINVVILSGIISVVICS